MPPLLDWQPPSRRLVILVCVLLLGANIFDLYHSYSMIGVYGTEANPIMRAIMEWSAVLCWILKSAIPCVVGFSCAYVILHQEADLRWRRRMWHALSAVTVFYLFVSANLIYVYLRALYPHG